MIIELEKKVGQALVLFDLRWNSLEFTESFAFKEWNKTVKLKEALGWFDGVRDSEIENSVNARKAWRT